jgi:uncharacterized protein DUF262
MTSQPPAASARPDTISLDVLLNDVDEGRIQIPRFQRAFVWTTQMMRELFESVLSGYPIGSLLFWTQSELHIATMEKIGPLDAPKASGKFPVSLVLDGHQRLATLYGVLRLPENHTRDESAGADTLGWWIGYDLVQKEPRQMRRPDDFDSPTILPLRAVLKTADFVRFARSIDASANLTEKQKSTYLDRADAVQRSIRDYRIALTIMRDGTIDDAVAIFSRINRSGRRITTDQMAVALTFREGFNLENALNEIEGELARYGFGDVSRTIISQTLLHGAGQDFAKPKFDDLRKKETQQRLEQAVEPVRDALSSAAQFFNDAIGFKTGRLLPYALQLLLLAVFFGTRRTHYRELEDETRMVLRRWFWATSFSGWFASANSAEVERAVKAMEAFAQNSLTSETKAAFEAFFIDRPLRPFPRTFDRRSARIRSLLLVEIVRGPLLDPTDCSPIDGSDLLADPNRNDLPYVFPPDGTKAARSPANRILLDRKYGSSVRTTIESLLNRPLLVSETTIRAMETHAINEDARAAIRSHSLPDFVAAREAELQRQESEFLKAFDMEIGGAVARSDDEVDVDEE